MLSAQSPPIVWEESRKFFFRFFLVYMLLYVFLDGFLAVILHATPLINIWDNVISFVGNLVFGTEEITNKPNGSGDTTYNYVQLFVIFSISIIGTLVWTGFGKKQLNHEGIAYGLRVFLRYYLGYIMIVYGLAKVFKTQFPYPTYEMLARTYGESSPMGLLWTFMGLSYPYNLFTGMGEVLGGLLLFFRRTTLLGALIIIGVMSNVVVLNFSYDVPVKIYSSHLLVMAFFLASPDLIRLLRFFITNQRVEPAPLRELPLNKVLVRVGRALSILVFAGLIGVNIYFYVQMPELNMRGREQAPLYGQYKVIEFEPQILSNRLTWTELSVQTASEVRITTLDGSVERITWNVDPATNTLDVFAFSDVMKSSLMHYSQPSDSVLRINGWFKGDSINVSLQLKTRDDFLLTGRGFHWINEYPFNR